MKLLRKIAALLVPIVSIGASAKQTSDKPDFAYPATVSKEAKAQLDEAIKRKNAPSAIEALLKYDVSQTLIDRDNAQAVIKLTESTAEKFAKSELSGIFDALLANLYYEVYSSRQWIYDSRELPLTPYPEDITEWSGQQFKQKITDYALASVEGAKGRALAGLKTCDYRNFVDISDTVLPFYPTLLDFAYCNAISVMSRLNDRKQVESLYQKAIADSEPLSAPNIMFTTECYLNQGKIDQLMADYDKYADSPYASYMLVKQYGAPEYYFSESVILDDWTEEPSEEQDKQIVRFKWIYVQAKRYLNAYPDGVFVKDLKSIIDIILKPEVNCTFPKYCAPGLDFDIKISAQNVNRLKLSVYTVSSARAKSNPRAGDMKSLKPVDVIMLDFNHAKPFRADTVATLNLKDPGYYVIVTEADGKINEKLVLDVINCVPAIPTALSSATNPKVAVTSPVTGAPVDKATVIARNYAGSVLGRYPVDDAGIADLGQIPDRNSPILNLLVDGREYSFDRFSINKGVFNTEEYRNLKGQILTDKAIYHPGDKVQALAVFTKSVTQSQKTKDISPLVDTEVVLALYDANYQKVTEMRGKTDDFGRFSCEHDLPVEGLTGRFRITAMVNGSQEGEASFMVSDYKMPEFEVEVSAVARNIPKNGDVTISGVARTYSGMPVADAEVEAQVSEATWRYWSYNSNRKIFSVNAQTDADGRFSVTIPDSVLSSANSKFFTANITATAPNGSTASTSEPFSTGKQYYIDMSIGATNIDGQKPFSPKVAVYAPGDSIVELPLVWRLEKDHKTVASGEYTGAIDLNKIVPGQYEFVLGTADSALADEVSDRIVIYNMSTDIVPADLLWVKDLSYTRAKGESVNILYGTPENDTYVYYALVWDNKIQRLENIKCAQGYHTLSIVLPDDVENAFVTIFTNRKFQRQTYNIDIRTKEDTSLKIEGESFRDKLLPGTEETWKFRIVKADGSPCEAAVALDMYNKALDALYTGPFNIGFYRAYPYNSVYVNSPYIGRLSSMYSVMIDGRFTEFQNPEFLYLDRYNLSPIRMRGINTLSTSAMPQRRPMSAKASMRFESAAEVEGAAVFMDACDEMEVAAGAAAADDNGADEATTQADSDPFDYRESEVTLAVWAPMLTSDKDGNLTYSFTVPNANTTWRLQAVAWTKDAYAGKLVREFVASKAVMVQPNLPRFLRVGDKAVVLASVMNNTDEAATINTVVELFNPYTSEIIATEKYTNEVEGKASATVAINVSAPGNLDAIGYRVRSSNGTFSDGEQAVIRILPNENALIETTPFYLNPGETEYTTTLPKGKDARISLTFCENPAWTIVTALPGLRTEIDEYANSAAAALFSACIARGIVKENPAIGKAIKMWQENPTDSALVSMLEKNEDLKIALLNSTPWVQAAQSDTERMANLTLLFDEKQTSASIKKALDILVDLQQKDGGWKWGKWCDKSSEWVTGNVLTMLCKLKNLGWLPNDNRIKDMTVKALRFWDGEMDPEHGHTDIIYTIVRPQFTDLTIGSKGKKVIDNTVAAIRKGWKGYSDPSYKAMAAEALYINNDKALANELMRSISEFGVWTPSQGLRFPSVNALYSYGIILEAYAMIQPKAKEVDGLRQQLIVRKQGTNWGSAVVTTEVVQSILSSGSNWTVDATGASVQVGNKTITPSTPMETATGNIRADLSAYPGKKLTVTTSGEGPAYGAVYAQFSQRMADVKAFGCDDLDIEKVMYKRNGLEWVPATDLKVGDRVKVQLTIHCKRNLEYVEIIDERPAAFEPVDQLPGWVWSEGTRFYRENRDSRTQLHVEWLNPGTYLLTYEMNVNTAGTYSSGVASIQSQYAPEISAHSSGTEMVVK